MTDTKRLIRKRDDERQIRNMAGERGFRIGWRLGKDSQVSFCQSESKKEDWGDIFGTYLGRKSRDLASMEIDESLRLRQYMQENHGFCTLHLSKQLVLSGLVQKYTMTQSNLLSKERMETSMAAGGPKLRIKIPKFDNSALVQGYARTLIGRCMNPRAQKVNNLLFMFPRIWNVEERVAGADLGMGRFQFDFDNEEDIVEVLKMEPFHFDHWMVSLVRWEPRIEPSYPSSITFWVRIMGVPLHYWAEPTFRSIGKALGEVKEGADSVDSDNGRVRVTINGFQPLCFETSIEFYSGEEVPITLRYERLFGYCLRCHSRCHDVRDCGPKDGKGVKDDGPSREPEDGAENLSYKGAVDKGIGRDKADEKDFRENKRRGKRSIAEYRAGHDKNGQSHDVRDHRYHAGTRPDGEMGQRQRGQDHGEKQSRVKEKGSAKEEGQCSEMIRPIPGGDMNHGQDNGRNEAHKVRKALFQGEETETLVQGEERVQMEKQGEMGRDANGDEVNVDAKEGVGVEPMAENEEVDVGLVMEQGVIDLSANVLVENPEMDLVEVQHESDPSLRDEMVCPSVEIPEHEAAKIGAESSEPLVTAPVRKKVLKGTTLLKGISSKKRLVQALISPRKRVGNTSTVQFGDGLYPAKPRKEPGQKGA